ncbi:MAG: NAD(P)H-binding protein [Elusimicrobiota bacterium]
MKTILVTGATGYVGGRLVTRLLAPKHAVRVLVRDPGRVTGRSWAANVGIARGDVRTGEGLAEALRGVHTAYYLIHSMSGGGDFASLDREAARRFGAAAREAGVAHIIYLGGLLPPATASEHLTSRAEVGAILAEAVPTTEFRARGRSSARARRPSRSCATSRIACRSSSRRAGSTTRSNRSPFATFSRISRSLPTAPLWASSTSAPTASPFGA